MVIGNFINSVLLCVASTGLYEYLKLSKFDVRRNGQDEKVVRLKSGWANSICFCVELFPVVINNFGLPMFKNTQVCGERHRQGRSAP